MSVRKPNAPLPADSARQRRRVLGRLVALFLAIPVLVGGLALGPPRTASADALSDAQAQQQAIQRQIADQKAKVAALAVQQSSLNGQITATRASLAGVNADLTAMRAQVAAMSAQIDQVSARYDELVATLKDLDGRLIQVQAEEALKTEQLDARRAQLAARIRNAYDQDRVSLLEVVLSSDSFTDILSQASYYLDIAAQDRALAQQAAADQAVLAEVHATVVYTREQTDLLRRQAVDQKASLDSQLSGLTDARAQLEALEAETRRLLDEQTATYAKLAYSKAQADRILADQAAAERSLQQRINQIIADMARQGNIPSIYNGSLDWPMPGSITQEYGCTGVVWEPPKGTCSHWHNGIDIAAPMYTPIRAAGPGTVVFVGANPYDSNPKAWIVIIAHSVALRTWYAHIDNAAHPPAVSVGQVVQAGQVIAYEGMTGRTTGPHLHWMVELESEFFNPRLFL